MLQCDLYSGKYGTSVFFFSADDNDLRNLPYRKHSGMLIKILCAL